MANIFRNDSTYYATPYQIIFLREINQRPVYRKGIVFRDWIIDATDGAYFKTKTILKLARKHCIDEDYAIVESFEWLPIKIN